MITWLFEIGALNLSTKVAVYNTVNYASAIVPSSFRGITMRWDISGSGLIAPNDLSFDVVGSYTTSQFEGEFCVIRLLIDGVEEDVWKFKIKTATKSYGKISCRCIDLLHDHLQGVWPNTPSPRDVWPSDDESPVDDYCIPVVLGAGFIPLRSVNTGTERKYVLGEAGTYNVHSVTTPTRWPVFQKWLASSYTMTQTTEDGYSLLQPIIHDSDGDGTEDATGLWPDGTSFMDMPCWYWDTAKTSTCPSENLEYILEDFGVDSDDIDATTFAAMATIYDSLAINFYGGFHRKKPREKQLSNFLQQMDSFLVCKEKIRLYQFSKTSVETIDNVIIESFQPQRLTKMENDSVSVHYYDSTLKPFTEGFAIRKVVPSHSGGTTDNPQPEPFFVGNIVGHSINVQIAGTLYAQKKLEQKTRVSFSVPYTALTNPTSIFPGKVITIDNALYGGTFDVVVTDMEITRELKVNFTCVELNYLEEWDDLSPLDVTVVEDTSEGFSPVAKAIRIVPVSGSRTFRYDEAGDPDPDPQSVTFKAIPSNLNVTAYTFTTDPDIKSQNTSSDEFTISTSDMGANDSVVVTVEADGQTDSIDVTKVFDGEDGSSGVDGITISQSNPAHTLPTTNTGVVEYAGSGTAFRVWLGATQLNYGAGNSEYTVTEYGTSVTPGSASTVGGNVRTYGDCSAMTADVANITFIITVKDASGNSYTFYEKQSLAKSIQGNDGDDGVDATNWNQTCVFSATDEDTVSWSSGDLITNGETYSISAGNTGNMTATTFIYFDPSTSETAYQTSATATLAVGTNKILVAVAKNQASGDATFQAFGGIGGVLLTGDNIIGNTITGNHFVASVVTTSEIKDAAENLVIDFSNAEITVNSAEGLLVNADSGISIVNPGSIKFIDEYDDLSGKIYGSDGDLVLDATKIELEATTSVYIGRGGGTVNILGDWVSSGDMLSEGSAYHEIGNAGFNRFGTVYANGVDLGDTELTDYEEGTYTATIAMGTGTVTLDSTYNVLAYTRVGRKVTVTGRVEIDSVSTSPAPSGSCDINLPFTPDNLSARAGYTTGKVTFYGAGYSTGELSVLIYESDDYMRLVEQGGTGYADPNTDFYAASTFLVVNVTYFTT